MLLAMLGHTEQAGRCNNATLLSSRVAGQEKLVLRFLSVLSEAAQRNISTLTARAVFTGSHTGRRARRNLTRSMLVGSCWSQDRHRHAGRLSAAEREKERETDRNMTARTAWIDEPSRVRWSMAEAGRGPKG
jgi:hypothetical protein